MLYHEIYGSYYRAVAAILQRALEGPVTRAEMVRLCNRHSFGDAALNIPQSLLSQDWPLLEENGTAMLTHVPCQPLTLLELRWLKAVSLDPRIRLFDVDLSFVEDVQPLFTPEDILYYDACADGDDYRDPAYQAVFRTLLAAVRERRSVRMTYTSRRGTTRTDACVPLRLEYSEKDDCFRVLCATDRGVVTRNVSGVSACEPGEVYAGELPDPDRRDARRVRLEITDDRNTLERMSLHFAHLRKEVRRAGAQKYEMTLWYDPTDEMEMVIRILQFGPMVRVLAPSAFVAEMRRRIGAQRTLTDARGEANSPPDD